jgi:hypothetical protein
MNSIQKKIINEPISDPFLKEDLKEREVVVLSAIELRKAQQTNKNYQLDPALKYNPALQDVDQIKHKFQGGESEWIA